MNGLTIFYDAKLLSFLYNTNASKANMNWAKDKRRNYFFSFKEHYTSIDSTFLQDKVHLDNLLKKPSRKP